MKKSIYLNLGELCHSTKGQFAQRTLPARVDFLPWLQSQGGAPISVTSVSALARNGGSGHLPGLRQTYVTTPQLEYILLGSFRICVITYTRAYEEPRQFRMSIAYGDSLTTSRTSRSGSCTVRNGITLKTGLILLAPSSSVTLSRNFRRAS